MSEIVPVTAPSYYPNFHQDLETLVSEHFQPLYALVNFFVIDPEDSVRATESIFRTTAAREELTVASLYRNAVDQIVKAGHQCVLLSLMTHEVAMCWLLKELGNLRYDDIAAAMELEKTQVKINIASARSALIPLI